MGGHRVLGQVQRAIRAGPAHCNIGRDVQIRRDGLEPHVRVVTGNSERMASTLSPMIATVGSTARPGRLLPSTTVPLLPARSTCGRRRTATDHLMEEAFPRAEKEGGSRSGI